ncbi:helix-turn-helix transcriptional regulator [Streptomyces sp. NPDC048352]|uniref:helix-turn-helix domain-containing protein n=1 Tax=Streptomyces sp. NPDC048352 TaxID=3154718 RepID=UPI0034187B61
MTQDAETSSGSELGLPSPKERRWLRESGGLTYEEAAARVGVTAATVRSWECGRTEPRGRTREAYAALLERLAADGAAPVRPVAAGPPTRRPRTAAARGAKPPADPPRPAHPPRTAPPPPPPGGVPPSPRRGAPPTTGHR